MPYANEHAARIKDPDQFDSFARQNDEFGDGIHVIYGIKEDEDSSEVQSIRFDKDKYTVEEAKQWLDDNDWDYIKFEPAEGEESKNLKAADLTECGECGHEFDSTQEPEVAMGAVKCPNCGTVVDQEGVPRGFFKRFLRRE